MRLVLGNSARVLVMTVFHTGVVGQIVLSINIFLSGRNVVLFMCYLRKVQYNKKGFS